MSKTIGTIETVADLERELLACFPAAGQKLSSGAKGGRPVTADIVSVVNNANAKLNARALVLVEKYPVQATRILAKYHLELSPAQRQEILKTKDGKYQPIDPETGHIVQQLRNGTDCGDWDEVFEVFENVSIPAAVWMAKKQNRVQFIRVKLWAATRAHRVGNGKTLAGRTAPKAHKVYVHSDTSKKQSAFFTLGIVHPDGRVERLGKMLPEVAPVPAEAPSGPSKAPKKARKGKDKAPSQKAVLAPANVETKAQRDARRKREKRAEAKALRGTVPA